MGFNSHRNRTAVDIRDSNRNLLVDQSGIFYPLKYIKLRRGGDLTAHFTGKNILVSPKDTKMQISFF